HDLHLRVAGWRKHRRRRPTQAARPCVEVLWAIVPLSFPRSLETAPSTRQQRRDSAGSRVDDGRRPPIGEQSAELTVADVTCRLVVVLAEERHDVIADLFLKHGLFRFGKNGLVLEPFGALERRVRIVRPDPLKVRSTVGCPRKRVSSGSPRKLARRGCRLRRNR